MCALFPGPMRDGYVNDLMRGRLGDPSKFQKLRNFALRKWQESRDLRHCHQWLKIIESIDRRAA